RPMYRHPFLHAQRLASQPPLLRRSSLLLLMTLALALWPAPISAAPLTPTSPVHPGQSLPPLLLPIVRTGLPFAPRNVDAIPVSGPPTDRPAHAHADLNLALRGYRPTQALLTLIDVGGPTDDDAPQLSALFAPPRLPIFVGAHQVYDWNWGCGADGCPGDPLADPPVTLLEVRAGSNELIYLPSRRAEILGGGYVALVLYAEPTRLTIKYTREDSSVYGYTLHVEGLQVDPALVERYRACNAAGRDTLPGLRNGDLLGMARESVRVAIRDTGRFMDPRTRKDWWRGY
ncbi:MAG: hypothetical protein ACRC1H_11585, partial [Caldilineaceae bacterium]